MFVVSFVLQRPSASALDPPGRKKNKGHALLVGEVALEVGRVVAARLRRVHGPHLPTDGGRPLGGCLPRSRSSALPAHRHVAMRRPPAPRAAVAPLLAPPIRGVRVATLARDRLPGTRHHRADGLARAVSSPIGLPHHVLVHHAAHLAGRVRPYAVPLVKVVAPPLPCLQRHPAARRRPLPRPARVRLFWPPTPLPQAYLVLGLQRPFTVGLRPRSPPGLSPIARRTIRGRSSRAF